MYSYITNHGFGPGTIPSGLLIKSVNFIGMKTIVKTDTHLKEEQLKKYDIFRYCPSCGKKFTDEPALSRKDNYTYVCPECGLKEAIQKYECYIERSDINE